MKKPIIISLYIIFALSMHNQQMNAENQILLEVGLAVKQKLGSPAIKQKIKEASIIIIKEANLSTKQLNEVLQSLTELVRGLKIAISGISEIRAIPLYEKSEYKNLRDEGDLIDKKINEIEQKIYLLTEKRDQMSAQKEFDKKHSILLDNLSKEIASKYPEYAAMQKEIDQMKLHIKELFEQWRQVNKKQDDLRDKTITVPTRFEEGGKIVQVAISQWPFEKIIGEDRNSNKKLFAQYLQMTCEAIIEGIQEYLKGMANV